MKITESRLRWCRYHAHLLAEVMEIPLAIELTEDGGRILCRILSSDWEVDHFYPADYVA